MTCEYCHSLPHRAGCPNEPEPKAIKYCDLCSNGIYPGDEIFRFRDEVYHADCVRYELSVDDILELMGIIPEIME